MPELHHQILGRLRDRANFFVLTLAGSIGFSFTGGLDEIRFLFKVKLVGCFEESKNGGRRGIWLRFPGRREMRSRRAPTAQRQTFWLDEVRFLVANVRSLPKIEKEMEGLTAIKDAAEAVQVGPIGI